MFKLGGYERFGNKPTTDLVTEVGENMLSVSVSEISDPALERCTWKQMRQTADLCVQVQEINNSVCSIRRECIILTYNNLTSHF